MSGIHASVPAPGPDEAAARIEAHLAEPDARGREPLYGILPATAAAPVLSALGAQAIEPGRMVLLAEAADAFRVHAAGPLFLGHAAAPHADFDGYVARIAAARAAATTAPSPADAPENGHRVLVTLVAAEEAWRALPELLRAFVAYAPVRDMNALEQRVPQLVAALDAAGRTDDGARLQARNVEDFGLNDLPRARMAVELMQTIRANTAPETRLDTLVAIHLGEDMRFREHLAPFAIRMIQDEAIAGHSQAIADAFLRAHARAAGEAEAVRTVRQAIAAQAAAWFGAHLDNELAEDARAIPPSEAGLFGTMLYEVSTP